MNWIARGTIEVTTRGSIPVPGVTSRARGDATCELFPSPCSPHPLQASTSEPLSQPDCFLEDHRTMLEVAVGSEVIRPKSPHSLVN